MPRVSIAGHRDSRRRRAKTRTMAVKVRPPSAACRESSHRIALIAGGMPPNNQSLNLKQRKVRSLLTAPVLFTLDVAEKPLIFLLNFCHSRVWNDKTGKPCVIRLIRYFLIIIKLN